MHAAEQAPPHQKTNHTTSPHVGSEGSNSDKGEVQSLRQHASLLHRLHLLQSSHLHPHIPNRKRALQVRAYMLQSSHSIPFQHETAALQVRACMLQSSHPHTRGQITPHLFMSDQRVPVRARKSGSQMKPSLIQFGPLMEEKNPIWWEFLG